MSRKKPAEGQAEAANEELEHGQAAAAPASSEPKEADPFPWYRPEGWDVARIDCTAYGYGVFVLREPSMFEVRKAQNTANATLKDEGKGDANTRRDAADLRAYVERQELYPGEAGSANVRKALPAPTAKFELWLEWYGSLPSKVAARLIGGARMFSEDYGVKLSGN